MSLFVDTSAVIAVIDAQDEFHRPAASQWLRLIDRRVPLITTNYVLLETTAFLRNRIGLDAVRALQRSVEPVIEVFWIDEGTHREAASSLVLSGRRQLSLTDLTSFAVMDRLHVDTAFTFDRHFAERGYSVVPSRPDVI